MSQLILTDAAIEHALTPGPEVHAPFDFTANMTRALAESRRPRLSVLLSAAWSTRATRATQLLLLLLLLLVLLIGMLVAGSLQRRTFPNGHVITVDGAGTSLIDVDPTTSTVRNILAVDAAGTPGSTIFGVSRSTDGGLISFWTRTEGATALEIVESAGGNRRTVATNLVPGPIGQGQIDVWSPDGRWLAAGVSVADMPRILVVDVASGSGELVGPMGAANPLWSPDGRLLAFSYDPGGGTVLAVMHRDGSGVREISGDLDGYDASGTNNWSPDGAWVYFGAERGGYATSHIYRANVDRAYAEKLTTDVLSAAPALSPDGSLVAYSSWPGGIGTQNLEIMDADGANRRLVLGTAINYGWSNDGQFLLAEWRPPNAPFQLVTVRPDGTDRHTVLTFADRCVTACAQSLGWGQPRP
jgi:hypothetical protein